MTKTKKKLIFLGLNNDLVFKHIFGSDKHRKYTIELISEILNLTGEEFIGAKITNSVKLNRETFKKKNFEVDVVVETNNGAIYNLEMQNENNKNSEIKNTMYVMRLFSGQLSPGETYDKTEPITQIVIVNGNTLSKEHKILVDEYGIVSYKDPNKVLLNDLSKIFIVDLQSEIDYTKTNKKLIGWLKLLKADSLEEAREAIKWNEDLEEVVEDMLKFLRKDYVQSYAESERLLQSNIKLWKKEGIEQGLQQGREEGSKKTSCELTKKMLLKGINEKDIHEITNLSLNEIDVLKKEIELEQK